MKQIDRRIVITVAFIFIVGLAYGIMKFLIAQKDDPFMRPAIEAKRFVKAAEVNYKTIVSPVSAPGRVSSTTQIDIIAEASGKILTGKTPLKKGSEFLKGDVLFTVYPDEAILALKSKKSQFLNSLANILPDIKIDYVDHENEFKNFFNAVDLNKKLPEFPEIQNEKLKVFLASRNILSDYYTILKDELQIGRHSVIAPFNGSYADVYMEAGAFTNTGGKVARAIQTDLLEIEIPLERFDAEWVEIGDEVVLKSETTENNWKAKVIRKSQFVDPTTQSQGIFLSVENIKGKKLLVGEYLKALFPGQPIENVMEVPRNVVFNTNEIFVIQEDRIHKKQIYVVKVNEKTLLFNGLKAGEVIVMQPLINVLEGTQVEIQGKQTEQQGNFKAEKPKDKKK